jgi:HEAT repeat protein
MFQDYDNDDLEVPDVDGDDDLDEYEVYEAPHPDIEMTIQALRDAEANATVAPALVFYGLSDIQPQALERLHLAWESLAADFRTKIMRQLVDVSETNFDLDFHTFATLALEDTDPGVREAAIELLWIDETLPTMRRLIDMALEDEAANVRAAAAGALGRYILLGEYGDLPDDQTAPAVDATISIYNDVDEDVEVRRRALESVGNSSHEGVNDLIREAYASLEPLLKVSAVFAMGRTCDQKWAPVIIRELNSGDAAMRYEAARSAGELGLEEAVPKLSRLVHETDREIQEVAIWALGEIGGREALRVLEQYSHEPEAAADEVLQEALEDAIASAALPGSPMLLDFDEETGEETEIDILYDDDFAGLRSDDEPRMQ